MCIDYLRRGHHHVRDALVLKRWLVVIFCNLLSVAFSSIGMRLCKQVGSRRGFVHWPQLASFIGNDKQLSQGPASDHAHVPHGDVNLRGAHPRHVRFGLVCAGLDRMRCQWMQ